MPETTGSLDEFVCAVIELAAADSSRGWLAAMYGAAAHEVPGRPDATIAIGHRGSGALADGRLTGTWESVVGAEHADWLILPVDPASRAMVARAAVHVEPVARPTGLGGAGIGEVVVSGADVERVLTGPATSAAAAAGAAAAIVGSADGVWRAHVDQVRARLAVAHHGDDVFDAVQVARAASDIDAAKLQITAAVTEPDAGTAPFAQAIARVRGAADRLLSSSRSALDASDPVAERWRDVHAGCRLATRILS